MTKTKAQKARAYKGVATPKSTVAVKRKALNKSKSSSSNREDRHASGLASLPMGMQITSDGLNQSMTMVNNSRIEEKFKVRFEKVTDLVGTTSAFAMLSNGQYFLNPGNTVLFPIFSKIATTYEQYRVNRLRFHFVTQCYTASGTNVGAGRIMMATNFDPDATNFATKSQMENYEKCVAFEPYARHVVHDVMEAQKGRMRDTAVNQYYVSGSANQLTPIAGQAKFYDIGNFQVAGSGTVDATSTIGELWVEYSFTMIRPVQDVPLGDAILAAHYITTPVTAVSRFGTGLQQNGSNMALTLGANTITIPFAGNFLLVFRTSAGTSYTEPSSWSAGTNGTFLTIWQNDTQQALAPSGSGGVTTLLASVISCAAPGVVVTFAGTPTIVGAATGDLWVTQVPSDLITLPKVGGLVEKVALLERMMKKFCFSESDLDEDYPRRRVEDDAKSVSSRKR